jgi:hypothetical protein
MAVGFSRSVDADVDENGESIRHDEPKVSRVTGKRRKGNPTKMDYRKINKALRLIENGNYEKQSVISAGLNYNTWLGWKQKGKKGIRPYDEFYEKVEQAKAVCETDIVDILNESIKQGNTGVAQWMLSRKFPKRWEKTERVEAKIDNSQKIEIVKFSDIEKESEEKEEDNE